MVQGAHRLHVCCYTLGVTRLVLHAWCYTLAVTRLVLHACCYTLGVTRLVLHAWCYTLAVTRLVLHAYPQVSEGHGAAQRPVDISGRCPGTLQRRRNACDSEAELRTD